MSDEIREFMRAHDCSQQLHPPFSRSRVWNVTLKATTGRSIDRRNELIAASNVCDETVRSRQGRVL